MDFTDLQMALTVVLVLTAAAVAVFFDQRRKQLKKQNPRRSKSSHGDSRHGTVRLFDTKPLEYRPPRRVSLERSEEHSEEHHREPLVAAATPFRPSVQMRERETVTVQITPDPAMAEFQGHSFTLPPITIDAELWERLITSQPRQRLLMPNESESQTMNKDFMPPVPSFHSSVTPSHRMIRDDIDAHSGQLGAMVQQPEMDEMLERRERFTGLVISIGINDGDSSMWHKPEIVHSIASYICSLLKEGEFASRMAFDEFVMVCPGEEGATAQRRLNHISERLWDYQLRGMGATAVMFSWDGLPVKDLTLADAIASATERMRETKRIGKSSVAQREAV